MDPPRAVPPGGQELDIPPCMVILPSRISHRREVLQSCSMDPPRAVPPGDQEQDIPQLYGDPA